MNPLPLPIRIAAGLLASAVEQARDLPRTLVELPVTAVSQTLQASMRVQQKVTELAIKGDRALAVLRPVEEKPSWATFDDEDEFPSSANGSASNGTVTPLRPQPAPRPAFDAPEPVEDPVDRIDAVEDLDTVEDADALALIDAAEDDEGGIGEVSAPSAAGHPDLPIPDYPTLTVPQLRGRLRFLTVPELHTLLEWETANTNRAPFVTMLANRITTVTES